MPETMTVAEFVTAHGVTVEILDGPTFTRDDDGWEHNTYRLRLHRADDAGRALDTPWRQGLGIVGDPEPADVLGALVADAQGFTGADGFEDWAQNYGYDPDSRRAERLYNTVAETLLPLGTFVGWETDVNDLTDPLG